jgi:hypothetical protein
LSLKAEESPGNPGNERAVLALVMTIDIAVPFGQVSAGHANAWRLLPLRWFHLTSASIVPDTGLLFANAPKGFDSERRILVG